MSLNIVQKELLDRLSINGHTKYAELKNGLAYMALTGLEQCHDKEYVDDFLDKFSDDVSHWADEFDFNDVLNYSGRREFLANVIRHEVRAMDWEDVVQYCKKQGMTKPFKISIQQEFVLQRITSKLGFGRREVGKLEILNALDRTTRNKDYLSLLQHDFLKDFWRRFPAVVEDHKEYTPESMRFPGSARDELSVTMAASDKCVREISDDLHHNEDKVEYFLDYIKPITTVLAIPEFTYSDIDMGM